MRNVYPAGSVGAAMEEAVQPPAEPEAPRLDPKEVWPFPVALNEFDIIEEK